MKKNANLPLPTPTEIHVWHRSLAISAGEGEALYAFLDPRERSRADRLHFKTHREAFIASHGWLRTLLGQYLGADPRDVHFTFGKNGKPAVEGAPLHFNFSHSGEMAACAVTRDHDVGIDIEQVRPMRDLENIARRFFHPEEFRRLQELSAQERTSAFFRCWTRREAYIKALGDGLFAVPENFKVALAAGERAAFVRTYGPAASENWYLFDLDMGPAYSGAVAVHGADWAVLSRRDDSGLISRIGVFPDKLGPDGCAN